MLRAYDPKAADSSIFDSLIAASARYGAKKMILEDQERRELSYTDVIRASFALGRKIANVTEKGERVAILLPTSAGAAVTFYALHAFGRVPVMLNFTSGIRNMKAACKIAGIKRILTARRFIEQGKLEDIIDALEPLYEITWLEDIRARIGLPDKLIAAASALAPKSFRVATSPDDPGVILFTSGSFGAPRGVLLSQRNLLANVDQIDAQLYLDPAWVLFNPLPVFHCFGLVAGVLLPLLRGLKAFQYPTPLHFKQIPPLIKDTKTSILFGTDTFISQYARSAQPDELSGLQFICCGAERVRQETIDLVEQKFGVPIVEGYGATEASPVIAVDDPKDFRHGTVGAPVPGLETRLDPVPGIARGAQLFVRGPNIMQGYLNENGELEPPKDGWHDTGDVVEIGDDGRITILGRVKRFAKIGGEMVSLTAAEQLAAQVWPDSRHAVISMPDPKKGERLVLVTDRFDATAAPLVAYAQQTGAPELAVPRKILKVTEVPVLGTGKTDYVAIQRIAEMELAKKAA
jgi:acyl-[acyl-carrier-protein]-phospholipid O-acyltransferase/long-chain-fatty-acid--[acyl-carrier-protein] ligase